MFQRGIIYYDFKDKKKTCNGKLIYHDCEMRSNYKSTPLNRKCNILLAIFAKVPIRSTFEGFCASKFHVRVTIQTVIYKETKTCYYCVFGISGMCFSNLHVCLDFNLHCLLHI